MAESGDALNSALFPPQVKGGFTRVHTLENKE
jgi:hypothetical protein